MNCGDIRKLLKKFQEDLLTEEEYREFVGHLESCAQCKDYVRSLGLLSNQIWELGDVDVPTDLASTIQFRLKNPSAESPVERTTFPKKMLWVWGSVVLVVILAAVVFGLSRRNKPNDVKPSAATSPKIVITQEIERKPVSEEEAVDEAEPERPPSEAYKILTIASPDDDATVAPAVLPLHWHIELTEAAAKAGQERIDPRTGRESQPAGTTGPKKQLESEIKRLKESQGQQALTPQDAAAQIQRKINECRRQLLNALGAAGIKPEYDDDGILVFSGRGRAMTQVMEQILLLDSKTFSFRDFTEDVDTLPNAEYRAFVFLAASEGGAHWHVDRIAPSVKSELLQLIKESGGISQYKEKEFAVFSVPASKLVDLRRRVQAMRIPFQEAAASASQEGILVSKPVTLSIYFSN